MPHLPLATASTPGTTPTRVAATLSTPSGWRHPKLPASTSASNAAAMHAAASATPRATGTSNTAASGSRTGSTP